MDLVEVVIYILAYIIFMHILVILHELGHAIVALVVSKEKIDKSDAYHIMRLLKGERKSV